MSGRAVAMILLVGLAAAGCSTTIELNAVASGDPVVVVVSEPTPTPVGPTASPTEQRSDGEPTPSGDPQSPSPRPSEDAPTPESSPEASSTPESTTEPTPTVAPTATASTPTPMPDPTATSVPTPPPTATPTAGPSPTPVPIEFVIGPDADLLGVELQTDAEVALTALAALIGDPDFDSGWYQGCPLDGDELDERLVQWGDLNVYFDRLDDGDVLAGWGYDLRIVDGGFPSIDLIGLPGETRMGDPVDQVAAAAGLDVVYDEVFDLNRVAGDGFEIVSDAPPGAPVWGAFVPSAPVCE